jgi:hypothetical protein
MFHSRHGAITGKMRRQRLVGQLEAHLVVALAGAAVRQRVAAVRQRHFHLLLRQQRPRDGSAQQILVLVDAARAHQLPQVLADELLAHVFDVDFRGARLAAFSSRPVSSSPPWPISPQTATTSQP